MCEDGFVRPLNSDSCPNDLHLVIGHALPPQIYQLLSLGLIDTIILNSLLTGKLYEDVPINFTDSTEYKKLVQDFTTPLYNRSLALIAPHLHPFYRTKNVQLISFFKKIPFETCESTVASNGKQYASYKSNQPSSVESYNELKYWPLEHPETAIGSDRTPGITNPIKIKHAVKAYSSGKISELALDVVVPVVVRSEMVEKFNGNIGWTESILNFDSWTDDSKLKDSLHISSNKIETLKQLQATLWLTTLRHLGLAPSIKYDIKNNLTTSNSAVESIGYKLATLIEKSKPFAKQKGYNPHSKKKSGSPGVGKFSKIGYDLGNLILTCLLLAKMGSLCPDTPSEGPLGDSEILVERIFILMKLFEKNQMNENTSPAAIFPRLQVTKNMLEFLDSSFLVINSMSLHFQSTLISLSLLKSYGLPDDEAENNELFDLMYEVPFSDIGKIGANSRKTSKGAGSIGGLVNNRPNGNDKDSSDIVNPVCAGGTSMLTRMQDNYFLFGWFGKDVGAVDLGEQTSAKTKSNGGTPNHASFCADRDKNRALTNELKFVLGVVRNALELIVESKQNEVGQENKVDSAKREYYSWNNWKVDGNVLGQIDRAINELK
ncbi:Protein MKT1 [Smittium mucronatum]|uniref:Protein MKT1 n=1 Tax=Smittium mucronatum TaxID=133383 RepID=A0A1R0H0X3_9FUNG|nr:Protein MKT1 [Smittium mucronatum]